MAAMNDDSNTPKALAVAFDLVRWINGHLDEGKKPLAAFKKFFDEMVIKVLGVGLDASSQRDERPELAAIVKEREAAKKNKDYAAADKLRNLAKEQFNVELKDLPDGTTQIIG
jgi:cysteinyl-tRNA synthetase